MSALSFSGARWRWQAPERAAVQRLEADLGLHPLLATCLVQRDRSEPEAVRAFLSPSMADLHDPREMAGMEKALARISLAARRQERVRIVTDYDVDGATSALILQAALGAVGIAPLDYHIPDRFVEGYGFSERAAQAALQDGVGLLITADVGVRDHRAVEIAQQGGADVIVCDHHLAEDEGVPECALAVLCPPQKGCAYPNKALAACGIALKLAQALLAGRPDAERWIRSLLKMAALGTVADVVDLSVPENRAIVTLGLQQINAGPNAPGLQALLRVSDCAGRDVTGGDLGFRLGPRINAAGRVEHAGLAVQLLSERDPLRAGELALELDGLNRRRRRLQERLVRNIVAQLEEGGGKGAERLFPVFAGPEEEGWHRGVVGIVAARVRDRLHRPAAVASVRQGMATGSIRSIPGVHAVQALQSASALLDRFGGHPAAAGFSLPAAALGQLESALSAFVRDQVPSSALVPTQVADARVQAGQLDRASATALAAMGPFGKGNRRPRLLVPGVRSASSRCVRQHLFFRVGGTEAVWWGGAEQRGALESGPVDLLGSLTMETWRGRSRPRLTVEDARRPGGS